MFWWYWSLRQRLMLLAAVLLPVVGFFAFRTFFNQEPPSGATVTEVTPSDLSESVTLSGSVSWLIVADDESRSAAALFPKTFGTFGDGITQPQNLVLPATAPDEYSLYLFFGPVEDAPAATESEGVAPPAGASAPTVTSVRESLRWHFVSLGGAAVEVRGRTGTEIAAVGVEDGRGYRATLRLYEVRGGVVVSGVVVEIPANEASDIVTESKSSPGTGAQPDDDPGAAGEAPAESPADAVTEETLTDDEG